MSNFAKDFARAGFAVIEGAFDPALIDAVAAEARSQVESATGRANRLCVGDKRSRTTMTVRGPLLDPALFANPAVMERMKALLGEDLLINEVTCVVAEPGSKPQTAHRDYSRLFPELPANWPRSPPFAVTVSIPLIDLDEQSGTTELFPGSHAGPDKGESETHLPYCRRGDCFAMDFNLVHRGTANRSAADRPMLYVSYARSWFIDMRNFHDEARLLMEREDFDRLSDEHRPLFRRLAGRGAFDASEFDLRAVPPTAPRSARRYDKD